MNLFFEQVNAFTRTTALCFDALYFEDNPILTFCLIFLCIGLPIIGTLWLIETCCYLKGTSIKEVCKKIWKKIDASFDEPEELKPMINAPTNRDFVIEMLRLRKETIEKDGYDPMCPPYATKAEQLAAEKVAATLERLVNEYPDPDEFNKALNEKFYINKEN